MKFPYFTEGFEFARTPKIYFGAGKFNDLDKIISKTGKTVLIVTGTYSFKSSGKFDAITKSLQNKSVKYFHFSVKGEPSPDLIDNAVTEFKNKGIDVVLAVGGGSVMDTGKAISAMLPQNESVLNYLEGVGNGIEHNGVKIPFIAVPTTAGTGSEATKNAVLSKVGPDGFKKSLRHDNFVPDIAVIDPELMLSCPSTITAACGMDAFTQLLESYTSSKSTPLTDTLAHNGLIFLKDNLVSACTTGSNDVEVRAGMAYASLISGITLANAGLGIVHGLASAIGGFFNIPHGVICGTLIGPATKANIEKLKNYSNNNTLEKYANVGALLSIKDRNQLQMPFIRYNKDVDYYCNLLVKKIDEWTEKLKIPYLSDYGIKLSDIDKIICQTGNKNNPIKLGIDEIKKILLRRIK